MLLVVAAFCVIYLAREQPAAQRTLTIIGTDRIWEPVSAQSYRVVRTAEMGFVTVESRQPSLKSELRFTQMELALGSRFCVELDGLIEVGSESYPNITDVLGEGDCP